MSALAVPLLAQTRGTGGTQLLLLLVMGVVFYLLLIRPQQRRARDQRTLLAALGPGDHVVTIGGLHGIVVDIDEETVRIEAAPGTVLTFARQAIGRRISDVDEPADEAEDGGDSGATQDPALETDGSDVVSGAGDPPPSREQL